MALSFREENAKTLAALLGVDEEEAAQLLAVRMLITYDAACTTAGEIARAVTALLARTVSEATATNEGRFAAELIIGTLQARTAGPHVWLSANGEGAEIATSRLPDAHIGSLHGALALLTSCYASALLMAVALQDRLPLAPASNVTLNWTALFGTDLGFLRQKCELGTAYLAGAGAVGNAFLYALKTFSVEGQLYVCDPKEVMPGSLNRCLWFTHADLNQPKATRLCALAQPHFKHLRLTPHVGALKEAVKLYGGGGPPERLIVGVDSRRVRRSLQLEFPKEVFDASTTDIREIVLHFNRQPSSLACLSCTYPENERELTQQQHIAEALGLDSADVQVDLVSPSIAAKILRTYPGLKLEDLIGRAFDTLFKELCGQGVLRATEGRQVLAPFSFVSVLAGTYLAIELVRRLTLGVEAATFNYWRASPWHNPILALRQQRGMIEDCEFCGNTTLKAVNAQVWGASSEVA